jgi:UDP-N-acetylmuramoyl-L-alanyl-D-glutamate--2,6-diaminopimelate ligase
LELKLAYLLKSEALKPYEVLSSQATEPAWENLDITGVAFDSRRVQPGHLFVCIPGFQMDGHDYAQRAVDAGAVAVVVEKLLTDLPVKVAQIKVDDARACLGHLAARFFDYPASRLATVGITGTNGKTSTAFLCETVLSKADQAPGLIGTIRARVGDEDRAVQNTTPESSDLQELLSDMVAAGNRSVVMEVSSHALALHRVAGIPFDVAVFTNLSQDHLDFHSSMEEYFETKKRLFSGLGQDWSRPAPPYAIVNWDDPRAEELLTEMKVPYITYGFNDGAHVQAVDLEFSPHGSRFLVKTPVGDAHCELHLAGAFNVSNALAAIGVGLARRIELDEIVESLGTLEGIPGRFELVREGQEYTVLVDYAHTPDGLENVLMAARDVTAGRLIAVFGCGGDRDLSKRPLMGGVAAKLADRVFLTSDNPRSEDPNLILHDIERGVLEVGDHVDYFKEADREAAIAAAIRGARPGDTVVIAGKGHERVQVFADHKIVFDDRDVARRVICARLGKVQRNSSLSTANLLWTECRKPLRHLYRDYPYNLRSQGRAAL